MALIIKCKSCKKRIALDAGKCPGCDGTDHELILDYMTDGRWSKRVRQRLPETITTVMEALSIEKILREKNKKKAKIIPPTSATVDDLFPDYLQWYELHRAKSTHRDLSLIYYAHYKKILGKEKVCLLSTENLDYYQKMRRAEKKPHSENSVANRTINKELNYFSGFLKWCRRHKKIDLATIFFEKLPYKRPRPDILSMDEVLRIIKAATPLYKAFILCLYLLGLRFSEARWLTLRHFDFEGKSVKVTQKGGSEKMLPVDDMLIEAIKDLNITDPDQYIFLNPQMVTLANPKGAPVGDIRSALERFCKVAKVDKNVHPHTFRHSWATHMLGEGVNLRVIQRYLGHAQVSTTEIYTHVMMDHLRTASNTVLLQVNKGVSEK